MVWPARKIRRNRTPRRSRASVPRWRRRRNPSSRGPSAGGRLFAVIPTVLVGGPLAILAMLFPAVFGGLMLVLRRWMAALSVLSLCSTLYVLYAWCGPRLAGSWWGTPLALWLTMTIVNLLGILWAWRRHLASLTSDSGDTNGRSRFRPATPVRSRQHGDHIETGSSQASSQRGTGEGAR